MKQSEQQHLLSHPNITNIQLRLDGVTKILLLQENLTLQMEPLLPSA